MISFPVILLRLTVALLLGAVIGFEREQKEHAAGIRTLSTRHLSIKASSISGQFMATIYDICARNKVTIEKLHLQAEKESEALGIICRIPSEESVAKVISEMRTLPEVIAIQTNLYSTNDGNYTLESPIT